MLDFLAAHFEPGRRYTERQVDEMLLRFHPDYCALRRYMVEEELMNGATGCTGALGALSSSTDIDEVAGLPAASALGL